MATLRVAIDARKAKVGANDFKVSVDVIVKDARRGERGVDRVDRSMKRMGKTAGSLRGKLLGLFAGFTAAAGLRSALSSLTGFEATMDELRAVTSATDHDMQKFMETARELGATTSFSAQQAAEGLVFLSRTGFSTQESLDAIGPSLLLAKVGMLELGEAADFASNIVSGFRLQAGDTERVVDVLAKTTNSSNVNVRELSESIKFVAPLAAALGTDVETAAAAIGVLGDNAIKGSQAGTNLRGIMAALLEPTPKLVGALQSMGLTLDDVSPATNNFVDILETLRDSGLDAERAVAIFGRRNVSAALALTASTDKVRELSEANKEAAGTAKEMADIMDDNVRGAAKELLSSIQELILQTGDKGLTGILKNTLGFLTNVVRALAGMEDKIEGNAKLFTSLASAIKIAVTTFVIFKGALISAQVAMAALNFVMAANPIGIILVGLSALIALLIKFRKETFTVQGRVVSLQALAVATFEVLTDLGKRYFIGVTELWTSIFDGIVTFGSAILDYLSTTFLGDIFRWIGRLGITWGDVWDGIKEVAASALVFVLSVFTSLEKRVMAIVDRLLLAVGSLIEGFAALGRGEFSIAADFFKQGAGALNPVDIFNEQLGLLTGDFAKNEELVQTILGDPREAVEIFSDDLIASVARFAPTLATVMDDLVGGDFIDRIMLRAEELQAQYEQAGQSGTNIFSRWWDQIRAMNSELSTTGDMIQDIGDASAQVIEDNTEALEALFAVRSKIADLEFETSLVGRSEGEKELRRLLRSEQQALAEAGVGAFDTLKVLADLAQAKIEFDAAEAAFKRQEEQLQRVKDAADAVGQSFAQNFTDAITGAESLNDAMKDLGQTIASLVIQQTIAQPIANSISGTLSSGDNILGSLFGAIFGSANGNVFQHGRVTPFADGGVINSPVMFPLNNGTGLAGEAGPEAIVPLQRDPNTGKLGVGSSGGEGNQTVIMQFPNHNADSFRRSIPQSMEAAGRLGRRMPRGRQ